MHSRTLQVDLFRYELSSSFFSASVLPRFRGGISPVNHEEEEEVEGNGNGRLLLLLLLYFGLGPELPPPPHHPRRRPGERLKVVIPLYVRVPVLSLKSLFPACANFCVKYPALSLKPIFPACANFFAKYPLFLYIKILLHPHLTATCQLEYRNLPDF